MTTLAEQIEKSYGIREGKVHCTYCKCEWKVVGSTSKFAHFSNKEIAKNIKFLYVLRITRKFLKI